MDLSGRIVVTSLQIDIIAIFSSHLANSILYRNQR